MRDGETRSRVHARRLRWEMTDAEQRLWSRLRKRQLAGLRFRRQHAIGPYIADFACTEARVVVELDGATHSSDEEIARDGARTAFIKRQGWIVLRYWNQDVYEDLGGVLDAIYGAARDSQSCMRSLHAPAADDSSTPSSRPPSLGHSAAASPAIGGGKPNSDD